MKVYHLIIFSFLFIFSSQAISKSLFIITNKNTNIDGVNISNIKEFFLLKKKYWPKNGKVNVIDFLGEQDARKIFAKKLLDLSLSDLDRSWIELRYRTGLSPQRAFNSSNMLDKVQSVDGSLGYVYADKIDNSKVKVVLVIK